MSCTSVSTGAIRRNNTHLDLSAQHHCSHLLLSAKGTTTMAAPLPPAAGPLPALAAAPVIPIFSFVGGAAPHHVWAPPMPDNSQLCVGINEPFATWGQCFSWTPYPAAPAVPTQLRITDVPSETWILCFTPVSDALTLHIWSQASCRITIHLCCSLKYGWL